MEKQTITYRFNKFADKNIGAIPTLCKAVIGMKYAKQVINEAFKKFVSKVDFAEEERDEILMDIYKKTASGEPKQLPQKPLIK